MNRRRRAEEQRRRTVRRRRRTLAAVLLLLVAVVVVIIARGGPSATASGQPLDTATFADGSCVAYPPTSGDHHETVFLDAGHGGIDPGGVGTTEAGKSIYEADETLPVELDAMALLRAAGRA